MRRQTLNLNVVWSLVVRSLILWRFLRRPFPWLRFSNRILSRGAFDLCFPGGLKLLFYLSRVPLRNRSIALRCVKRWYFFDTDLCCDVSSVLLFCCSSLLECSSGRKAIAFLLMLWFLGGFVGVALLSEFAWFPLTVCSILL